ncbi:hypothetical protein [Pedobacter gandavensis]|uniref:hypothetical protein n=1 Tax=Pedobacter gandavensis TaxID=2679963 RepID=UPI00293045E5|nr:hypothetical protein [Pedobacter gandavensis]
MNEQINKLPSQWSELKLNEYITVTSIELTSELIDEVDDEGLAVADYLIKVASVLLNINEADIRADFNYVVSIVNRLKFILQPPVFDKKYKSIYKWKAKEKLTYDEYISLMQILKTDDMIKSLPDIIKIIIDQGSPDPNEIAEMNMDEVYHGFFLHKQQQLKSLKRLQTSTMKKLVKQQLKALFNWRRKN